MGSKSFSFKKKGLPVTGSPQRIDKVDALPSKDFKQSFDGCIHLVENGIIDRLWGR